jgi:hypothetical protein
MPASASWKGDVVRLWSIDLAGLHSRCGYPKIGTGAHAEAAVSILTPEEPREKSHQHLIVGLRLIRPAERLRAIAAALNEVETLEKQRPPSDSRPRFLDS